MPSIGDSLRQRREQLGLTLEEAERVTRIRSQYLEALERDDLDAIPSPVQARGFLKNYSDYLGLRTEEVLRQYTEQKGAARKTIPLLRTQPRRDGAAPPRPIRRRWFSMDLVVAAVISLGILALLVWGAGRLMASLRERTEQAQESSGFLIATTTASPTASATAIPDEPVPAAAIETSEPSPTSTLPPLPLPSGRVTLRLIAQQRTWIRVLIDGRQQFQGRLLAGDVLDYAADRLIEVSTGNGAAVRVLWNGQDTGLMGALDEVVTRLWTSVAVLTPTPTITPTVSASPPPTATPPASPTAPGGPG
ncbi:MAG TPA: RodZ domain-containing protein [bacterium]|nr:RodZ domain-containing protein [bacterium]